MPDPILTIAGHLELISSGLAGSLPAVAVHPVEPPPDAITPFVVVTAATAPARVGLAGVWSRADLTVTAWSVHDTAAQALALADLVRTWVLTEMALPGQLDVVPASGGDPDDPGGVHQVRETWGIALARS